MAEPDDERKTVAVDGTVEDERTPDRGVGALMRRHSLVSFYVLAYGLSWVAWLPYVLSENGVGIWRFSFPEVLGTSQFTGMLFGAYLGPLGAAFLVTALAEGRPGLRRWGARVFRWRVSWRWYAVALLAAPVVITIGTVVVAGTDAGLRVPPVELLALYVPFLLLQVLTTGLAEEPGWRDFALVRHQQVHGPFLGTLILGVLWAGWHFPLFLTDWGVGVGGASVGTLLAFTAFCIVFNFFITWIFNKSGESLPVALLAHCSVNNFISVLWLAVFPTLDLSGIPNPFLPETIGFAVVALVLLVATRGRLGYRPESHADEPLQNVGGTVERG